MKLWNKFVSIFCILAISGIMLGGCGETQAQKDAKDTLEFFNLWFLLSLLTSGSRSTSSSSCSDSCSNSLPCCTSRCCSSVRDIPKISDLIDVNAENISKCESPLGDIYPCSPEERKGLKSGSNICKGSGSIKLFNCNVVAP